MNKPPWKDFIAWNHELTQIPWPLKINDFDPYAEKLGWAPTQLPD